MFPVEFRKNIIDICIHFFLAAVFSLLIYLVSANLRYSVIFFLGGILIDLDHFIDHFFFFRKCFRIKDFFSNMYLKSGKVYVFLHSWEIVLLIFVAGIVFKSTELMLLSLSFAIHLAVDNTQKENLFFYLLLYRARKKFDVRILIPEFYFSANAALDKK